MRTKRGKTSLSNELLLYVFLILFNQLIQSFVFFVCFGHNFARARLPKMQKKFRRAQ